MKVSLNTLAYLNSEYSTGYDPYQESMEELLKRIGEQLGAVEGIDIIGSKYEGIIVVKVVSCEKHPDADKLHICRVDDGGAVTDVERGDDGFVQVVCGAPNVKAGMIAAWLPPGITVPSTINKDPFVLEVREIRGQKSNGMLASLAELDISDNHSGILEIKVEDVGEDLVKLGTPFKNLYSLDDVVIDMENKMFTHRPDCFGMLGVARELAGISGQKFASPDWYKHTVKHAVDHKLELHIDNEVPDLVPRFMAQAMFVEASPSPMWLQSYLSRIGQRTINNIVDSTNFFMMETAQPMHAFDYDKIAARSGEIPTLKPRMAQDGEELTLLNGKTIKLTKDDIVIATDKQPVALAGVMGGADTEVDNSTKKIIIECATFDMYSIRRTSMRHGLFTDAVTRYTKGQSPLQNDRVLAKIVQEFKKAYGGKVASEAFDIKFPTVTPMPQVIVGLEFINDRLGSNLNVEEIAELLKNVEFEVSITEEKLSVTPPFWRRDIEIPEDIVEEVGRLYGFHKLTVTLPKRPANPAERNPMLELNDKVRQCLSAAGANELLTYSFVHGDLIKKVGQDPEKAFHIRNAISPDLQFYRISLTPSLLDKVHANIKSDLVRGDDNEFAIFEIGKGHIKGTVDKDEPEIPYEEPYLAFTFAADDKTASRKYSGSPYYQAKNYLKTLLTKLGVDFTIEPIDHETSKDVGQQVSAPFEMSRSASVRVNGKLIGFLGEYRTSVKRALKLPQYCAGFEIALNLFENAKNISYTPLPAFPKTQQDVTFEVSDNTLYEQISRFIGNELEAAYSEHGYFTVLQPRDIFQAADSDMKRITFRIWFSHYDRTLTTEEVNIFLDKLADTAKVSLNAVRIV